MIVLRPTEAELHLAANVGVLRQIWAKRNGLRHTGNHNQQGGFEQHINGALGEMMLARQQNIFWGGTIGTINAVADVGACYQVRATTHPNGKLIVYPEDNNNQPFILARILLPEVHLMGWLWGHEAKFPGFWREDVRCPAWFAWPLHDMDTLPTEAEVAHQQHQAAE